MDKKTSLYDTHVKYGGTMVPFAGYLLPIQYKSGIKQEHLAVRNNAGLFDVSHMGEILVEGRTSLKYLNYVLTNDFTDLKISEARYSPMCNEAGGTVDDLIVYKLSEDKFLVVVNAANEEKDFNWMVKHKIDGTSISNISKEYGQLALQGPNSEKILLQLVSEDMIPKKSYTANLNGKIKDIPCIISRTGYTGEDGFEIYMPADQAPNVWELLMTAGKEFGLIPCGLGARDTLRMEAGMPLYGHEMNDEISPKTAGLGFAVKMDKDNFIGKEALEKDMPLARRRVGLKVTGRGIIRENEKIFKDGEEIGFTTSGTFLPYMDGAYALAIVDSTKREIGAKVNVSVRGRNIEAEMVKLPFYKREK